MNVDGRMILQPTLLGSPSSSKIASPTSPGSNQLVVLFAYTLGTVIAQSQFYSKHLPSTAEKAAYLTTKQKYIA